ncbi:centromere protein L-like [Formica exsecta]|uniref:centromere protein L-like n=1 Tax=Formica exsecta TaxID=72781 RepID=UPI001144AA7B|nr:centromere protein L-like [Formica exsecta]
MNPAVENTRPSGIMYTPRTPQMRERQRFNLSTRPDDEEIDISGLENLVGQTWNIYAVSALFGLQQDDIHFKLYSKRLREEIANTLSHEDVSYDARFSIMEDMVPKPNHENYPAIKIEVLAKINDTEKEKSLYQGILLSWRITQDEPNIENLIRLPLLLCRGTSTCIDAVHATIIRMFDCLIIALPAKEHDLSWLIPIIIMTNKEEPSVSGEVQMVYTVPELPVTDTVTVKFQTADLRKILSAIMTNQNDEINIFLNREHIEIFFEILHKQMLMVGGLKLGLCTLHRINLPGITIMENKMKIVNVEIMNNVLSYLNEKAFDIFHTVHIDI